ncbi:MAG TPA: hypothetical protein VMZ30_14020 [Pyrinomonadaceae bacterium]|nr:hypothetical protein [Pyrinomonadaceae bacterium]
MDTLTVAGESCPEFREGIFNWLAGIDDLNEKLSACVELARFSTAKSKGLIWSQAQ